MKVTGNIRKMVTSLQGDEAQYLLPLYDIREPKEMVDMNTLVGENIAIQFENEIHCVATGKPIKKTFGDGLSYDAFMNSPLASPSIIRPELSRIHEGIALRDKEWEEKYHLRPHVTYLSLTSGVKVGVTSATNVPSRWIDQGAVAAIKLAEVPYRQLAGLIEVAMKDFVADKTNWRTMLKNEYDRSIDLLEVKDELLDNLPEEYHEFVSDEDDVVHIKYPVQAYPTKLKSLKLDKVPLIAKKLVGIKGQYLIFDDESVFNMRSHSAYKISLSVH